MRSVPQSVSLMTVNTCQHGLKQQAQLCYVRLLLRVAQAFTKRMYTPSPMRNGAMGGGAFFDALHLLSSHISICVHAYVLQRTTKGATGRHIHSCVGCFRTMREKGCPSAMIISPLETQSNARTFVFAFDEPYVKHFSVVLLSLIEHSRSERHYDIVVLHDCVSRSSKRTLQSLLPDNFTLRFFNVGAFARSTFSDLTSKAWRKQWDIATFYDMLVPLLMPDYERVLFCDSDRVFTDDPDELFCMSFDGAQLIAVRDSLLLASNFSRPKDFVQDQLAFVRERAGIQDLRSYFNAGVMLFNIAEIDSDEYVRSARQALELGILPTVDQDAMNCVFKGHVKIAPP